MELSCTLWETRGDRGRGDVIVAFGLGKLDLGGGCPGVVNGNLGVIRLCKLIVSFSLPCSHFLLRKRIVSTQHLILTGVSMLALSV